MKIRAFKKVIPFAIFLATLASLSSCNRGVGCPNNFSIGETLTQCVEVAANAIIRK